MSVVVKELLHEHQDSEIRKLAHGFAADTENEYIDDYVLLETCVAIRMDPERSMMNVFIAYDDDRPVGFLLGATMPCLHRRGVVAEQRLWYVDPSSRGTAAARKLIKAYEQWARLNGAIKLYTGVANKRYAERTSRLLEHLGYTRVGAYHLKDA